MKINFASAIKTSVMIVYRQAMIRIKHQNVNAKLTLPVTLTLTR
jgi:hypothetical protein